MQDTPRLVACILTRDEADNIRRSVTSVQEVTADVVVIDSASVDATCAIARELGAHVVTHSFEGFSAQRNWALKYISQRYNPEYILAIDADEWLSAELIADLRSRISTGQLHSDVYLLHRRVHFDGKALRWGGFANTWLPRLFRTAIGRYEDRPVNEHLSFATSVTIGRLRGDVINADVSSWYEYISKHNRYSTLEARARIELRAGLATGTTLTEALRLPYLRRRWLRQNIWDRLPARPAIRFIQVYVIAGGVMDGRPGFRRALFEAWQEMCTDLKAEELERAACK